MALQKADLLDAIVAHVCGTEEPILEGMAKMAFSFIRSGLDRDAEKYESTCEKRRKAANDRWHKDMHMNANVSKSINSNAMHYEGDTDNRTDNDNGNVSESEGVQRAGTDTHTPTRDQIESLYQEVCRKNGKSPRVGFVERFMKYNHSDWRRDIELWTQEDIRKGIYSKPANGTNRFLNFEQSGTDWNAVAERIMERQEENE